MASRQADAVDPLAHLVDLPWMQTLMRDEAIQTLMRDESIVGILTSDVFAQIVRSPRFLQLCSSPEFLQLAKTEQFRAMVMSPEFQAKFVNLPALPNMKEIKDRGYHMTTIVDAFQRAHSRYVTHDKDRISHFYAQLSQWPQSQQKPRFVEWRADMFHNLIRLQRKYGFEVSVLNRACQLADTVLMYDKEIDDPRLVYLSSLCLYVPSDMSSQIIADHHAYRIDSYRTKIDSWLRDRIIDRDDKSLTRMFLLSLELFSINIRDVDQLKKAWIYLGMVYVEFASPCSIYAKLMACLYIFFFHVIDDPVERHKVVEAYYTMMVWITKCTSGSDDVDIAKVNLVKDQMGEFLRDANDDFLYCLYRDLVAAPLDPGCCAKQVPKDLVAQQNEDMVRVYERLGQDPYYVRVDGRLVAVTDPLQIHICIAIDLMPPGYFDLDRRHVLDICTAIEWFQDSREAREAIERQIRMDPSRLEQRNLMYMEMMRRAQSMSIAWDTRSVAFELADFCLVHDETMTNIEIIFDAALYCTLALDPSKHAERIKMIESSQMSDEFDLYVGKMTSLESSSVFVAWKQTSPLRLFQKLFKILNAQIQDDNMGQFHFRQILVLYMRLIKPSFPVLIAFRVMMDLMMEVFCNVNDSYLVKSMMMRWAARQKRSEIKLITFQHVTNEINRIYAIYFDFYQQLKQQGLN